MTNIGIVGAGGMGTVHHSNYAHIEDCRVAALVGVGETDAQKAKDWGLPLYGTITEMCAEEPIDLVDICTPTFLHKAHALESIACGKDTIVEKPVALTASDAREMFAAAKEKGVLLFVAQVLQFTKEVEVLRGLVQSGEYGPVLDGWFERLSAAPLWAGPWMLQQDKSGLLPFDLHIHDLDVIVSLFGRPDEYWFTASGGEGKAYKEQYRFNYRFGKLNVAAEAAWYNAAFPFTARWRVYFEKAVVVNDGQTVTAYTLDAPPRVFDTEDPVKIPTGINLPPTGIFLRELSHFMDCVKNRRESALVPQAQLLQVVEILQQINIGVGEK